jgi:hypothetical protein
MTRQMVFLTVVLVGIVLALIASAAGWFGSAVVCGADRSPGCITWPMPASVAVWAGFVIGVAALVVWQIRFLDR